MVCGGQDDFEKIEYQVTYDRTIAVGDFSPISFRMHLSIATWA
jgi:hypothetical protein